MTKRLLKYALFLLCVLLLPLSVRAADAGLQSGDRILLYFLENAALSGEPGILGLRGKAFDPEAPAEALVWTLQKAGEDWILENPAGRLSLDGETLALTLNGAHDRWRIRENEGRVILTNTQGGWVLTWFPAQEIFEVSPAESEFSQLILMKLPEPLPETTTETTAETTTEPPPETTTETTGAPDPSDPPATPEPPDMEGWDLYFGQLHAHTADSDGLGTPGEAFAQAAAAGLDFFAVTEHSDSFDNDKSGSLADGSVSAVWTAGKAAAMAATTEDFVAIYGFEMSWNQGQGHISTFNTPGFLSRDQEDYEKYKDGMERYFDALSEAPESVSQLNHPGTFYGDFKAFSVYDPQLDPVIALMEVGSGAGSEYQTAYDAYVQALDKGWHLAPTNNHNNHEGQFGSAGSARTVILAKELKEESLYAAMKARRVYATEDSDLQIHYALDGAVMGSQLRLSEIGERAELVVKLYDPTDIGLGLVEVIGPGGQVAASAEGASTLSFSLPAAEYYFIRVTQPDGDMAVTAPVWISMTDKIGISDFRAATDLTREGEAQSFVLTLFNQEGEAVNIRSVTLREGDTVIGTAGESELKAYGTKEFTFTHTFETDGVKTLRIEVLAEFAGEEQNFAEELAVSVLPRAVTGDVLIDGTHGQTGTYGEFRKMAEEKNSSVRIEGDTVTAAQLAACRLLVIPAPERELEPEFLELIKDYVNQGGNLLLLGCPDSRELNRLLENLESSLRLSGDILRDDSSNDGDPTHLFTAEIARSEWTAGILEGQIFAHSGCAVTGGEWLVKTGAGDPVLAAEGKILLSGGDFLQDVYLRKPEHPWALGYANRIVAENLLGITRTAPEIAPIGDVRKGNPGSIYLVEGLVTAGTHNVNTDFPGSIYIQDATGALEARGYSTHGLELGRRVRILGCLGEEAGRPVLDILQIEILEKETPLVPESLSGPLDYDARGDQLLGLEGTVIRVEMGDTVKSFTLRAENEEEVTVLVEDFILSGSLGYNHLDRTVKVGNRVSAVGLCYLTDGNPVLRLRDCDEVVLLWEPPAPTTAPTTEPATEPATQPTAAPPTEPATEPSTLAATETTGAPTTEATAPSAPAPTARPAPPAYPDNPATGDRTFPGQLLLIMGVCCVLLGITIKKGHP